MTYEEHDASQRIERLLATGGLEGLLGPDDLDRLDQFHVGGTQAVDKLIDSLTLAPGAVVLDVGSGFGGPARQIARSTGSAVHGVDITSAYVDAANALTVRCGLEDLVSFEHVDVAALVTERRFDAAITMHVQMNVADKAAWFAAIGSHLESGARLAVWEICATGDGPPAWPMPWSIDGTDSHLAASDDLRGAIEAGGFDTLEWHDETTWVNDWFATSFAGGPPSGPALPMVIDDGFTRVINLAGALADGTLSVWRGTFERLPAP